MNSALDLEKIEKMIKRLESKVLLRAVEPGEWVLSCVIESRYGLTDQAMKEYRYKIWPEGIFWHKNQKGRVVYNTKAIGEWMATPQ